MKTILAVCMVLFACKPAIAQDMLKLKGNRTIFNGQMIRLDWSSFKFRMNDGGIIQQVTEQIDSLYLGEETKRAEAARLPVLQGRLHSSALLEKSQPSPVMAMDQTTARMDRITAGLHLAGQNLNGAGALLVGFLACEFIAIGLESGNSGKNVGIASAFAIGGLGCLIGTGITLVKAGNKLKNVDDAYKY